MHLIDYEYPAHYGSIRFPNIGDAYKVLEFDESIYPDGSTWNYRVSQNIHSLIFSYEY